jgi:hypothetical protein
MILFQHDPSWLIDFGERDIFAAKRHKGLFAHLEKVVLPTWNHNAEEEKRKTGKTRGEHQDRLQTWWLLKRRRGELMEGIEKLSRYIVCSAVTKRQIFEFISCAVRPSNALKAFLFEDDYAFGIISSGIHWAWFTAKCSTLTERFRYTPDTVFDMFPWPQSPAMKSIRAVAETARALRTLRREIMDANGWSLRELYKSLETPGENSLRTAHAALDTAVRAAYGMKPDEDILAFLLKLNLELAEKEAKGETITPPGLPSGYLDPQELVTADCIQPAIT